MKKPLNSIKTFLKNETVLVLSLLLALLSMFAVKPSFKYLNYIDFRTLALLFCLMLVMAGLNRLKIFQTIAVGMIRKMNNLRGLSLLLCLLCFFSSMIITNDVALITFVPFTIITLKLINQMGSLIYLITLETISANLGSMLTPIGNPQNLYLFSVFHMSAGDFVSTIFPYAMLSFILIVLSVLLIKKEAICQPPSENSSEPYQYKLIMMYCVLFTLSLLTVFRVLPYWITLLIALALVLAFDRSSLLHVDYSLLLTFVFLFIFIGNLGNIESINRFLRSVVTDNEVIAGVLASQIFSNVPAAILLSGFTANASALLIGVNIGGLGTLIASMASLISYKFVVKEGIKSGKYLTIFSVCNLFFLVANLILWRVI